MNAYDLSAAKRAIVRVGEGRGFIVQGDREDRYVIAAARCLPTLPPGHPAREGYEQTCVIGAMEDEQNDIWTECLFVDLIADIAVLGAPDNQGLPDQWEAYSKFVRSRPVMRVGEAKPENEAWLLSQDENWHVCCHNGGRLWISDAVNGIVRGMSGSPIVLDSGAAVGIVNCSEESRITQSFPNARLAINLPGWLLQELKL